MNGLVKDSTSIIHQNQEFFDSLSDMEQVIVYGHSFYEVDWPYMKEIVKHIGISKLWAISYYKSKDLEQINSFIKEVSLENVRTFNL